MKNIAGYKFISLNHIEELKEQFLQQCTALNIRGTILLSEEGININLAGTSAEIDQFMDILSGDNRFSDIPLKISFSETIPFQRMKVKLKKEIITMRKEDVDSVSNKAPVISPAELKQWLDEGRDITLLDTRNDYEVRFGTFDGAKQCHIDDFCKFPEAVASIDTEKPIVMFCTGGVRCEKAGLYMLQQGAKEVYQLDGGILNYFEQTGGAHYHGDCFVFDERVAVNTQLRPSGIAQCQTCQGPTSATDPCTCS